MPCLRTLLHLLLALALVANGALVGRASAAMHSEPAGMAETTTGMDASCHEDAAAAPASDFPAATVDCCGGGTCACSCLNHAPVAFLALPWLPAAPYHRVHEIGRLVTLSSAPSSPATRPPIA